MADRFQNFLHHSVSSNHIPAHCGYAGNERADFLAKKGAFSGSSVSDIKWSMGAFKEVLNSKLKLKLDDHWKSEVTNPTTLDLIPDIMCLRKIEKLGSRKGSHNFLNWFLSGCCPLRKYLHAIKKSNTDKCLFCEEIESRHHFILDCGCYEALRGYLIHRFQLKGWPNDLKDFHKLEDGYEVLLEFIISSKRFDKIKKSNKYMLLCLNIVSLLHFSIISDVYFLLLFTLCATCSSLYSL